MKRLWVVLAVVAVCTAVSAPRALAWGLGTHVYIAGELIGKGAGRSLEQAYAACLPDMLNFATELDPFRPDGPYDILHGAPGTGIDLIGEWTGVARTDRERATAFGYLCHAAPGCADDGAHIDPAYAVAMAHALYGHYASTFASLDIDEPTALFFCEIVVEDAIDLMLAEADRSLGGRMTAAAASRGKGVPALLGAIFGDDFAAHGGGPFLVAAEAKYRLFVMDYGRLLALPPADAQAVLAGFLAMSGLETLGVEPGTSDYENLLAQFTALADSMLSTSKLICSGGVPSAFTVLDGVVAATGQALEDADVAPGSRKNR